MLDAEDLLNTGKAIQAAFETQGEVSEQNLRSIADAYHQYYEYQKKSRHKNFHGMSPSFMSGIVINLLKACETTTLWSSASQMKSTTRMRYEGWLKLLSEILAVYQKNLKKYHTPSFFYGYFMTFVKILEFFMAQHHVDTPFVRTPVLELIKSNTEDDIARHLMIISNGDAAVGALEKHLYS